MRLPRSWAEDGWIDPFPAAQAAIWAREVKPSLDRIFATWRAAVAGLITSSSAMPLLLYPRAISAVISRSRGVSDDRAVTPRGTPGPAAGAAWEAGAGYPAPEPAAGGPDPSARVTAASGARPLPSSHSPETASGPRLRAASRYCWVRPAGGAGRPPAPPLGVA